MTAGESLRQSLLTVGIAIAVWVAWMLRDLVMLVGFAALLAYALDPVVSLVARIPLPRGLRLPRGVAAGLVVVILVLVAGWALAAAVPRLVTEISRFVDAAPGVIARLEENLRRFVESRGWIGLLGTATDGSSSYAAPLLRTAQTGLISILGSLFGNLKDLAGLVLLPLLTLYLLADGDAVRTSVLRFAPETLHPKAMRVHQAVDKALRAYVRGQAAVCLIVGVVTALVLQVLGYPVALLLGVTAGLAEVIPFLGFWIAATVILLAGLTTSPGLAVAGLVAYLIVNTLMSYLVSPRLLGREIKLHPFVVTVSIMGGSALLGPGGAILALPAVAIMQALVEEFGPKRSKPKR
ncbi:MAG TPA: AI-2E family transporter [Candidatus Eisenbacteria bacterium]|nr:AI-2E family transporter [Candidatus Eisenbacteria bacterium]